MGIELKTMTGDVEFDVVYECDCGNLGTVKIGAQFECCGMVPQTEIECDECGEVRTVNCEILVEDA